MKAKLLGRILSADFHQKKYVVKVNNNSYTVEIANDLDLLIKELGFEVTKQITLKRLCRLIELA
jgi:hypothetical protein